MKDQFLTACGKRLIESYPQFMGNQPKFSSRPIKGKQKKKEKIDHKKIGVPTIGQLYATFLNGSTITNDYSDFTATFRVKPCTMNCSLKINME